MLSAFADLLWAPTCPGCGRAGTTLCIDCCRALLRAAGPVTPDPAPAGFPATCAIATYDGCVRQLLIAYKERGRHALVRPLGAALAAAVLATTENDCSSVSLVPVPATRKAIRQRGFDHVADLATTVARLLKAAGVSAQVQRCLRHAHRVADQSALTSAQRQANLAGAFEVHGAVARRVVVVDDVVTTGATLAAAARALSDAGVRDTRGATIAATARRIRLPVHEIARGR